MSAATVLFTGFAASFPGLRSTESCQHFPAAHGPRGAGKPKLSSWQWIMVTAYHGGDGFRIVCSTCSIRPKRKSVRNFLTREKPCGFRFGGSGAVDRTCRRGNRAAGCARRTRHIAEKGSAQDVLRRAAQKPDRDSNEWLAARLAMVHPASMSKHVSRLRRDPAGSKTLPKHEKVLKPKDWYHFFCASKLSHGKGTMMDYMAVP